MALAKQWAVALRVRALFAILDIRECGEVSGDDLRIVLTWLLHAAHVHPTASTFLYPPCSECKGHVVPASKDAAVACTCPCSAAGSEAASVLASLHASMMAHAGASLQRSGAVVQVLTPNSFAAWLQLCMARLEGLGLTWDGSQQGGGLGQSAPPAGPGGTLASSQGAGPAEAAVADTMVVRPAPAVAPSQEHAGAEETQVANGPAAVMEHQTQQLQVDAVRA